MSRRHNPLDAFHAGMQLARIGMEANAVIAMRTMGMMGVWATKPQEVTRMVTEKPEVFADAWAKGVRAALSGASPSAVMTASLRPIAVKTGANQRRLARLGPKGPF